MASNQDAPDNTKMAPDNCGILTSERCSISEVIHMLGTSIVNLVPGVMKEVKCVKKVLDEIEKEDSFKHHEDPRIAMDVEKLKQAFRKVIVYSGHIKNPCRSLASYSSNQEHIQSIKEDLQSGKLQKLKRFLQDVGARLERCSQCLGKLLNQLQMESLTTKHESANLQIKENKKQDNLHYTSLVAVAGGVLGGLCASDSTVQTIKVLAVLTSTDKACKPKGTFTGIIGHAVGVGATASAGTAISLTQRELEILDRAKRSLLTLQKKMNKIKTEVHELELSVNSVIECVESSVITSSWGKIKRLKCPLISPASGATDGKLESICDIEEKLDELQTEMEKALKILESEELT